MKYLRGLAVVFVIFVLPAGSWFYLQSGYNYRLNALNFLEPKGQLQQLSVENNQPDLFDEKISLICLCSNVTPDQNSTLDQLEEKYDSRGFQIIRLSESDPDYQQLKTKYSNDILVLIDKDRQIRSSYSFESENIKELVQHVAIVIPIPSRKKIKLKREG